jgi:AcrR family transcriptional regulator
VFDKTSKEGRVLAAALELAASRDWADIGLLDIAEAAKMPLGDMRDLFASKAAIIAALLREVDREVLSRVSRTADQEKRDVLFDVLMTRFDVLAPYKPALKSMARSGADLSLVGPLLSSQNWMLQAAGIDTSGPGGALRIAGLAGVYASVFRTWLEDDDPGHARTMAALDRRLRRGERTLRTVDGAASALHRFATDPAGFVRSIFRTGKPPSSGDHTAPGAATPPDSPSA